jgi:hypothetical protein
MQDAMTIRPMKAHFSLILLMLISSFLIFYERKIKKDPKRHGCPLEASYRHLLETPFHKFLQTATCRKNMEEQFLRLFWIGIKLLTGFVFLEGP